MYALVFLKAALLGLSVAAPVGPIGVLCIRRTLSDGPRVGFACGLGAATADGLYGLGAAMGLAVGASRLAAYQLPLRVGGGLYLLYLGMRTFTARSRDAQAPLPAGVGWRAWGSTFLLTVTNPMTILSFAAMFSAIGAVGSRGGAGAFGQAGLLVSGVFLGSTTWWLGLSAAVGRLRGRLTSRHLVWINRGAGGLLLGFGLLAVGSAVPL